MGQRRGFLRVPELEEAGARRILKLKSKKLASDKVAKKNIKLNVSA